MGQQIDLSGYRLTFADEFAAFRWNGGGNTGTWNTTYSYGERKLNDELQVYSDPTIGIDPFSIRNGALVITAAPSTNLAQTQQPYTSGVITSHKTFAQRYGYFEMRAQLPLGQGLWPAFWLLPVQHIWPPELDVVEAFGNGGTRYHWGAATATSLGNKGDWVDVPAVLTGGYHRYGVDWTAETLTFYFDGTEVARTPTPADMNQPMYLIANLAVGGHWAGNPSLGTTLPAEMLIDYIRAYSADPAAAGIVAPPVSTPDAGATEAAAAPVLAGIAAGAAPQTWLDRYTTTGTDARDHFQTFYGDTATRTGGLGDDTYVVTDPRMDVAEAPDGGVDTVEAWVDCTLAPHVENLVTKAGWGLRVSGNAGSNTMGGAAGDDTIDGGPGGDDRLSGGGGRNLFVVAAGSGRDTITDFAPGAGPAHDRVLLDGFSFRDPAAVLAALGASGMDTVLQFANGETLTFWGVRPHQFTAGNFLLSDITVPPAAPATFAATPDRLSLFMSEDAFGEDARFTVAIDGRTLGGPQGVSARHGAGASQRFDFSGEFGGAGPHQLELTFLNDAWGGEGRDRNLYLDSVVFNGASQRLDMPFWFAGTKGATVVAGPPEPALPGAAPDRFAYTNTATGVSGREDLRAYTGPVANLRWQGAMPGSDGVAVATDSADVFLVTGTGNDAIAVTRGDNVLDGGSGSNFLVGGSGHDTFFLDARAGVTTWNTIVGFHSGSRATIWGYTAADAFRFIDTPSGAPGFEGATLRASVGGTDQSLTFAGVSNDTARGFTRTTGEVGGVSYMLVECP